MMATPIIQDLQLAQHPQIMPPGADAAAPAADAASSAGSTDADMPILEPVVSPVIPEGFQETPAFASTAHVFSAAPQNPADNPLINLFMILAFILATAFISYTIYSIYKTFTQDRKRK